MDRDLYDLLVCPECKASLALEVSREEDGAVVSGTLACTRCQRAYPVADGVPDLRPAEREN